MKKKSFILVMVPFKDEIPLVLDFINSLFKSSVHEFSFSFILWDDGSNNDEIEVLKRSIDGSILILKHGNVGYTQAAFNCVEFAKSQQDFTHLLLVNSDVKFEKDTMMNLVQLADSNSNIVAVGGKVVDYRLPNTILHTGTRLENGSIVDPYCKLHRDDPKANFVERRLWVNGCCVLYNLDILRKENLNFDLEFKPSYFEEADLMTKLNVMGYSVMYEPKAIIHHLVNATHNKERDRYEKVFWTNWNKYLEKWSPKFKSKELQF
jgi:GT2 family glycosyltransferase